jgi:dCTP diphosphatase
LLELFAGYKGDGETTVAELKQLVVDFTEARGWTVEHNGKNLAMSIMIEAAELMEHFQWGSAEECKADRMEAEQRKEIAKEVADVAIYLLSFCREMGIDLAQAVKAKMEINEGRFPVEAVKK